MPFSPGSIFFCQDFQFDDGGFTNKLLVLLHAGTDGRYLFAKTTSRPRNRATTSGCHPSDGYYLLPGGADFFRKDTWILFLPLYERTSADILTLAWKNRQLKRCGVLSLFAFGEIVTCLLSCLDVKREHKRLISGI